jgi:Zn-finger nucleic acid-binding protein
MCSGCAESYLLPNRKIHEREKKKHRERERDRQTDRPRGREKKKQRAFFDELFGDLL